MAALVQQGCDTVDKLGDKQQAALAASSRQRCRQTVRHVASSPLSLWGKSILPMPPAVGFVRGGNLSAGPHRQRRSIWCGKIRTDSDKHFGATSALGATRKISRKFSAGR